MRCFARTIGIDYSGASTADANLTGIRVYQTCGVDEAREVAPPMTRRGRKNWSRRDLAEWLVRTLADGLPTIVGIDHGFSFPLRYFELHQIEPDWDRFLDDFGHHWPADLPEVTVECIRRGRVGEGNARFGDSRWRRLAETACGAKSVFHFDVQGSVAKSTHAGIPWLRRLRRELPDLHFWPFDGWLPEAGASVVCEIYPSLHAKSMPSHGRNAHQQDAWAAATWMRDRDACGGLVADLTPEIPAAIRAQVEIEGWILGVPAPRSAQG